MATQIPYHQRKSQRLQKQVSSSHRSPLFEKETMTTKEESSSKQGHTDQVSAARHLRRMQRRLLMQAIQVEPSATSVTVWKPLMPETTSPSKPSMLKRRTTRVSKKKVAGSNKSHNRYTSCFF